MSFADDYRLSAKAPPSAPSPTRGRLPLPGTDRASYLQGLLTNDIQALTPGTGCYAAWLTPQGRMLTDMHVLESGDMHPARRPGGTRGPTLEQLDQFLFTEDVQLASLEDSLTRVWLHGPAGASMLERTLEGLEGIGAWPAYTAEQGCRSAVRRLSSPGSISSASRDSASTWSRRRRRVCRGASERRRRRQPAPAAIEAARIEAGYPLFGIDMTADTIPLEAGIEERAISFTKGCYVGQEVIIRVLHRGHGRVAKKLVALRFDGRERSDERAKAADGRQRHRLRHQRARLPAARDDRPWLRAPRLPRARDCRSSADGGRPRRRRGCSAPVQGSLRSGRTASRPVQSPGLSSLQRPDTHPPTSARISSWSAGGNSSVGSSAADTHRICWPSTGRGRPRSVQRIEVQSDGPLGIGVQSSRESSSCTSTSASSSSRISRRSARHALQPIDLAAGKLPQAGQVHARLDGG